MAGDRIFVKADRFVTLDTRMGRVLAPIERFFGAGGAKYLRAGQEKLDRNPLERFFLFAEVPAINRGDKQHPFRRLYRFQDLSTHSSGRAGNSHFDDILTHR